MNNGKKKKKRKKIMANINDSGWPRKVKVILLVQLDLSESVKRKNNLYKWSSLIRCLIFRSDNRNWRLEILLAGVSFNWILIKTSFS